MKTTKILFLFLASLLVVSCGSKEDKLKKQYIEACADGDFEKARVAINKLEAENSLASKEGLKFVNDKEIYYLLAKPSRDNDLRIMYLYNSFDQYELPDMKDVVEVAISMGNENLAEKLIRAGVEPDANLINRAVDQDMENLCDLMLQKNIAFILIPQVSATYRKKYGEESFTAKIIEACKADANAVFDAPNFAELISSNENIKQALTENLSVLLNTVKKQAPSIHSQGIISYYDDYVDNNKDWSLDNTKATKEMSQVKEYNSKLLQIYSKALLLKSNSLAMASVNSMLPAIEIFEGDGNGENIHGFVVDGNHKLVYHNYDEIKRLKKELNQ